MGKSAHQLLIRYRRRRTQELGEGLLERLGGENDGERESGNIHQGTLVTRPGNQGKRGTTHVLHTGSSAPHLKTEGWDPLRFRVSRGSRLLLYGSEYSGCGPLVAG